MEPGSTHFHTMKVDQIARQGKDSVYESHACFPIHMRQNAAGTLDSAPDSSTAHLQISCHTGDAFGTGHYFHSSPDIIPFSSTYQCSGSASEFSRSANKDSLLSTVVRTRRRKAGISDEERICIVCGEPASGYNFDRLTCESCKAFFRRNALKPKDKIKVCSRGGGCIIEGNQRKHCPSCRLEKCFAVGMKRELILPPEKLEQRAKPRRRKHTSSQGGSCSPQHVITTPSSVGSGTATIQTYRPTGPHHLQVSSLSHGSNVVHRTAASHFIPSYSGSRLVDSTITTPTVPSSHINADTLDPSIPMGYNTDRTHAGRTPNSMNRQSLRPVPSTFTPYRRSHLRRTKLRRLGRRLRNTYSSKENSLSTEPEFELNHQVLSCLQDCVQQIREPFTPDGHLETGVAVTLEQEYNRMDACIRRIIRVVKLLPYFAEIGKPAQLSLLRANIYGLIVLYSSFFFESGIRKLNYPILQRNGQVTTVTVSMLDEVVAPDASEDLLSETRAVKADSLSPLHNPSTPCAPEQKHTSELREEFELYKANTLAAFDHLDQLIGTDDILRVCVLAIKLFTDDSFISEDLRASVSAAREAYLRFLWAYLRWRAGPKHLRSATELYARLLIAFIDLRTLEIRMTEFAKLLSLDSLSPLMREVCSQRNNSSVCSARM
ncbi:Nuclear hormone receptor member daf-12 [Clonorchis sinensis]|uniref:Nuclear hormone receptor member daf-12 n=1 Tax=Clonorchis sinensis TaxID=79923 RepID=A0A3R7GIY7_CLOSI|nr:Nuclear hormone receptor member daf-12 [Clonorchis sinensis]